MADIVQVDQQALEGIIARIEVLLKSFQENRTALKKQVGLLKTMRVWGGSAQQTFLEKYGEAETSFSAYEALFQSYQQRMKNMRTVAEADRKLSGN